MAFIHNPLPTLGRPRRSANRCSVQMREFWVAPLSQIILTTAVESNFRNFLLSPSSDYTSLARFESVVPDEEGIFDGGIRRTISNAEDVKDIVSEAGKHQLVIVDATQWKYIPAENLIAVYQHSPTKLFTIVRSTDEAQSMFQMLEVGVDGCVLETDSLSELIRYSNLRNRYNALQRQSAQLSHAEVKEIIPVASGERVCIDTCSILKANEGLLVGSSSQRLFLILSEAAEVDYVPSRPFRVNAGPVHAYVALANGKTKYLCEIVAGDEVMVFDTDGNSRTAVVGRAKIEARPLLLVKCMYEGRICSTFVQNAETVRLPVVNEGGIVMKSIVSIQPGEKVCIKAEDVARHIGMPINENLVEQ